MSPASPIRRVPAPNPITCRAARRTRAHGFKEATVPGRAGDDASDLEDGVRLAVRLLDVAGHVVDPLARRGSTLETAAMRMTMHDGAHLKTVDRFGETRGAEEGID